MLVENTLWGPRDKVQIAIARLQAHEPREGYYLAFSGGKDSQVIYRLAELADVKFDAHYHVTTVDPPELVRFIKQQYPQVHRHRPEMSMFRLMVYVKHWPPMRRQRWCCELLKERGGSGRMVVTGIRWEESPRRVQRRMIETCYQDPSQIYLHPIIDWKSEDVWAFIHHYDMPYCSLYDEGFARLGCILCPLAADPQRDIQRWPQFAKAYIRTFDRLIAKRRALGKRCTFETGQQMFDWWIRRNTRATNKDQMRLFD